MRGDYLRAGDDATLLRAWLGVGLGFLWVCCCLARPGLLVVLRGPEREVVAEQLHDEGGVLVALLVERVELRDGLVEGLPR